MEKGKEHASLQSKLGFQIILKIQEMRDEHGFSVAPNLKEGNSSIS